VLFHRDIYVNLRQVISGSEAPETIGGKPLPQVGHRISRIDMLTGQIYDFANYTLIVKLCIVAIYDILLS